MPASCPSTDFAVVLISRVDYGVITHAILVPLTSSLQLKLRRNIAHAGFAAEKVFSSSFFLIATATKRRKRRKEKKRKKQERQTNKQTNKNRKKKEKKNIGNLHELTSPQTQSNKTSLTFVRLLIATAFPAGPEVRWVDPTGLQGAKNVNCERDSS